MGELDTVKRGGHSEAAHLGGSARIPDVRQVEGVLVRHVVKGVTRCHAEALHAHAWATVAYVWASELRVTARSRRQGVGEDSFWTIRMAGMRCEVGGVGEGRQTGRQVGGGGRGRGGRQRRALASAGAVSKRCG